jgi:AcrR family transcriptional regulator
MLGDMTPRAAPLSPDERRRAIVDAVLPLLIEHGRAVTTRQMAEAAGIAEGTIFRVFDSKDALIDAALTEAFRPGPLIEGIERIDPDQPLRERLVAIVTVLQDRFVEIFGLMRAVGLVAPPRHPHGSDDEVAWRERVTKSMAALVEPDRDRLRVPPEELLRLMRLLTFSGSHIEIADNRLLTPEEIVDVIMHGTCTHDTTALDET